MTARIAYIAFLAFIIPVAALVFPLSTWAASGNVQTCNPNTSCVVGEFLYNDSYAPITNATCNITSRNPDGTFFLNSQVMTVSSQGDGWYSRDFTTPATKGTYRTQVCCTAGSDFLCLDKTFEVKDELTSNTVASSVWSYSNRSLSTFGTVITDIWNNASRTLTGANSDANIADIRKVTKETRNLVEQIVNKPVVETVTEEAPDLQVKLKETEGVATKLFVNTQQINSKVGLTKLKWDELETSEVLDITQEIGKKLGAENDSETQSIFGQIGFLKKYWDWDLLEVMTNQAKAIKKVLLSIQKEADSSSAKASYDKLKTLVGLLSQFESLIGDSKGTSGQKTLFATIKDTKALAESLDKTKGEVELILSKWDSYKPVSKQRKLNELSRKVSLVNRIPNVERSLLISDYTTDKELRNKSYFVLGIISSNKKLLAAKGKSALSNTWLEIGSVVFKSLITNPSTIISQKAPLKYYLPQEVKEEHIIEVDEDLSVKYDPERGEYFVTGEFLLAPSETKTVSVKVQDVWTLNEKEIESLRKQVSELSKPLDRTSYFAQGVTLKSDIDVSLDKALELTKANTTPEAKIRAYREAKIEIKAAKEKIEKLKELVTQAGSIGAFFGFVGGSQTLAVWGLIIIISASFIFLTLYMRILIRNEKAVLASKEALVAKEKNDKIQNGHDGNGHSDHNAYLRRAFRVASIFLIFGIGSGLILGILVGRIVLPGDSTPVVGESKVLGTVASESKPSKEICETLLKEEKVLGVKEDERVKIVVPQGSSINVRSSPKLSSSVLTRIKKTAEFIKLDQKDGWVKIAVEENLDITEGWVSEEFVKDLPIQSEKLLNKAEVTQTVVIADTPTGFLRVRLSPWGEEITQVHPGDTFTLIKEIDKWFQIELRDGVLGWIYSEYATKG